MSIIRLQGVSLSFPHHSCFSGLSAQIEWGQRIALVGDNGSGKSSLLKLIAGILPASEGKLICEAGVRTGYVAQIHDDTQTLSGGQRVNAAFSQSIAQQPDLLLLDEPNNHLDQANRHSMLRMLKNYYGTLILITHDENWMNQLCNTLWILHEGELTIFQGRYEDWLAERDTQRSRLESQRTQLRRECTDMHQKLMKEQERASHARQRGLKAIEERRWATIRSATKLGRGNTTAVNNRAQLLGQQHDISLSLQALNPGEQVQPAFFLPATRQNQKRPVLQLNDVTFGYGHALSRPLSLQLHAGERLHIGGNNGSGKSTLARAIAGHLHLRLDGEWFAPPAAQIACLDQHYANLEAGRTVLAMMQQSAPEWSDTDIRQHLARFLFRHDDAVQKPVAALSGGERARLSLACIAARPPELLILDEVSNNLDSRTRRHVADIVREYPGCLLIISHDERFMEQTGPYTRLKLETLTS